ncbi:MAG: AAA family ATPase, partial [Candidatus Eremiobacteraeota bacterium]|nr:AAA family ATPase [Candidatus Eremiobacteraeota bacterium]
TTYLHNLLNPSRRPFSLVAFYRANRQWSSALSGDFASFLQAASFQDAYRLWDNASEGAADLKSWAIAKSLERFQTSSETGVLFDDIRDDELALVNGAIHEAIEEFRGLRYDMKSKSLLVQTQDEFMPFDNLSDGQQGTIGLVADIARRMCILNPQLGEATIRETEGVVLIDELDLHLHPGWQRNLTRGLKRAFPKVQFIVTSHSPQILAELQPEEIILLEGGGTEHPQVSYGLDASRVLEEVMGTASRPLEVEEKLKQLFRTLETGSLDEAARQIESLREKAPGVAELSRAEALLERKKILGR